MDNDTLLIIATDHGVEVYNIYNDLIFFKQEYNIQII